MQLMAGQRIVIEDENKFLLLQSGKIEVYAVTDDEESFRQFYMMTVDVGEAVFPAMDDFGKIKISVYAVEDSDLQVHYLAQHSPNELQALMKKWFKNALENMSWLQLVADKGDEILLPWQNGTVLQDKTDLNDLIAAFTDNEQILSMFLGLKFGAEDKRLSRRTEMRLSNKKMMVENAIRSLLDEEKILYSSRNDRDKDKATEDATFVVRMAAKNLGMPTDNISIGKAIAKKLDSVGILRRLAQKGNMQIRLVTLEDDWYKNDTGVLIGFYGKDKDLAALLPDEPYKAKSQRCRFD